ncbi:MAG: polysaccharide lyase family protein, partial [Planctomycetes bacterium]|nr:polysaccharide lyase family protein [Planctomycetota bacterium]
MICLVLLTLVSLMGNTASSADAVQPGTAAIAGPVPEPRVTLWEIGKADRSNAEFALAPGGYARFTEDGFFVVGSSDPAQDWPYVHPGPSDGWAGSRPHTFIVLFGLKGTAWAKAHPARSPAAEPAPDLIGGECRLALHLIDTHASGPPTVRVEVNGRAFERSLPPGAGDASVHGQ